MSSETNVRTPPPAGPQSTPPEPYPVNLAIDYQDRELNRTTTFFRIFVAIPILVIIGALSGGTSSWWGDHWGAAAGGVIFIPPQLAETVVQLSEHTRLRDLFGHQRLREQKYTAGQIDRDWTPEIEADFTQWLKDNADKVPVDRAAVQEYIAEREKAAIK